MKLELAASVVLFVLCAGSVMAQGTDLDPLTRDSGTLRTVLQQGGLFAALMLFAWFYRRDLLRWADEKKEESKEKDQYIASLVELVKSSTQQLGALTSAVQSLSDRRQHQRSEGKVS